MVTCTIGCFELLLLNFNLVETSEMTLGYNEPLDVIVHPIS